MLRKRWLFAVLAVCGLVSAFVVFGPSFWRDSPSPLRDRVLYWDVDFTSAFIGELSLPGSDMNTQIWYRVRIQEALEDERGWQASGVDFRYFGSARRPDILFEILGEKETFLDRYCRPRVSRDGADHRVGCAKSFSLDGRTQCRIVLPTWLVLYPDIFLSVIDHELGHCFGFKHSEHGLMAPALDYDPNEPEKSGTLYPSNEELAWLREQMDRHPAG